MKTSNPRATKAVYPIVCQIVNAIPTQFIAETAKAHRVLSRTFSPKSHVAAMPCCQVSKTESLNSICDVARANDAAKLHLTFDLGNRLPSFAIVKDAAHHDSARTAELTAHLKRGDIAVADRAYTDCGFMNGLDERGVRASSAARSGSAATSSRHCACMGQQVP